MTTNVPAVNIGAEADADSIKSDIDLLNEDEPIKDVNTLDDENPDIIEGETDEDEIKVEEEEEEETDEQKAEKAEKEEKEDKDANVLPGRPTFKELRKEYPDIFKKFPGVRDALSRESKYTRIFPTIDNAVEANQMVGAMNMLQERLMDGDPDILIRAIQNDSEPAAEKFAENIIPKLHAVNPKLYEKAVTPLFRALAIDLYDKAKQTGKEDDLGVAQRICMHLWGQKTPPAASKKEEPKVNPELERTRAELNNTKRAIFSSFSNDVMGGTVGQIRKMAAFGLDPENKRSEVENKAIAKHLAEEVEQMLKGNPQHMAEMGDLWKNAERAGFTPEWKSRIARAYLERAKPLLVKVKAGLKSTGQAQKPVLQQQPNNNNKRIPINRGIPSKTGQPVSAKQIDWNKTSDEDMLNDRVTLKK